MAQATLEVIIKAIDEYSKVANQIKDTNNNLTKDMQKVYDATAAAITGSGIAIEAFARKQQDVNVSVARLANDLGLTKDQIREVASAVSSASTPIETVLELMDLGKKQGIESAEGLREYAEYWAMVGDATGEKAVTLAEAAVGLRALGIGAEDASKSASALGYITENTTISASEFLSTVSRLAPQLSEAGLSINDVAAYLAALEQKGITGRNAIAEFREALTESGGDTQVLNQQLGITQETFNTFSKTVADSGNVISTNAAILQEYQTPLQELQSKFGDVAAKYGDMVAGAAQFAPALMAIGPGIEIFGRLQTAAASAGGAMALITSSASGLGAALLACAPYILAIGAAIAALYVIWTNNLGGIQEKTAAFVSWVQDRFSALGNALAPVGEKLGEVGGKIADHLGKVSDKIDGLVRKLTGGSGIVDILNAEFELLGRVIDTAFSGLADGLVVAIDIIGGAIDYLIGIVETLIDWFDKIADHPVVQFLGNLVAGAAKLAGAAFDQLFPKVEETGKALDKANDAAKKTSGSLKTAGAGAESLGQSAQKTVTGVKDLNKALSEITTEAEKAAKGTDSAAKSIETALKAAGISAKDVKQAILEAVNGSSKHLDELRTAFEKSGGTAQQWADLIKRLAKEIETEWGNPVTKDLKVTILEEWGQGKPKESPGFVPETQNATTPSGATDILAQANKYQNKYQQGVWKNYGTSSDPKWYYTDYSGRIYGPYAKPDNSLLPSSAATTAPATSSGTTSYPSGVTVTGQSTLNPGKNTVEGEVTLDIPDTETAKAKAAYLEFYASQQSKDKSISPTTPGIVAAYDEQGNHIAQWAGYYQEVLQYAEQTGQVIEDSYTAYSRYVGKAGNVTEYLGQAVTKAAKKAEESVSSTNETLEETADTATETAQAVKQSNTAIAESTKKTAEERVAVAETSGAREVGTVQSLARLREIVAQQSGQNVNQTFSQMGKGMGDSANAAANSVLEAFQKMREGAATLAGTAQQAGAACSGCGQNVQAMGAAINAFNNANSGAVLTPTIPTPGKILPMGDTTLSKLLKGVGSNRIPLMADGGDIISGGLAVIGEQGPELLSVPKGATVTPLQKEVIDYDRLANAIARALGGNGGGKEVHLHTSMIVADDAGLRKLARMLKSINIAEDVRTGAI